jgi:acetolactate synthase-1/2/3 large subunit
VSTVPIETGAAALVAELERAGIELVFGLPGVHNLAVWAALARSDIRLVGVRHEQTAVYAADGLARATGGVGVALTTTGPGAANAVAATGEAWASKSPVVVIATDIATTLRRPSVYRGVLHETRDQAAMFRPVSKRAFVVRSGAEVASVLRAAIATALSPPAGPVYVGIPTDVLTQLAGGVEPVDSPEPEWAPPAVDDGELRRAVAMIDTARRPVVWAGGGVVRAGAGPAVAALAERIGAPVLETYAARGAIRPGSPGWVGLPPHVPEAGRLWDDADLVIAIGSDLDGMMTQNWRMPAPASFLAINVDADDAVKNYQGAVVVGDARQVCELLLQAVAPSPEQAEARWDLEELRVRAWTAIEDDAPTAVEFLRGLAEGLPADAFVAADMCIPGYWTGAFHPFPLPRRLAYPVGWGTLGFAFPASLGAALSGTGPTLCVCGDGGFLFACGELATVAQEQIPVTILLTDDGGYGVLRYDQLAAGEESVGVDLLTPDWLALAGSFGIEAERVPSLDALGASLRTRLESERPSLLVLEESLKPPVTTSARWHRAA